LSVHLEQLEFSRFVGALQVLYSSFMIKNLDKIGGQERLETFLAKGLKNDSDVNPALITHLA
jgi:hypothetical protein